MVGGYDMSLCIGIITGKQVFHTKINDVLTYETWLICRVTQKLNFWN